MAEAMRNLVVVITRGIDHEPSSAGLSIASAGITAGPAGGYRAARAADMTHVKPLDPLVGLLRDFLVRGGNLWACRPECLSRISEGA